MATMTQKQFDKLALAQVKEPIGSIGSREGCSGMTRCRYVGSDAYKFYDVKKIAALVPKSTAVKRWAEQTLPQMFLTCCENACTKGICDDTRYVCVYKNQAWTDYDYGYWFINCLDIFKELDLSNDTWLKIADAIFNYSCSGRVRDSYWSDVFNRIPVEHHVAIFDRYASAKLYVLRLNEYLDRVKYLLAPQTIKECVKARLFNMRMKSLEWIDQFIDDDNLCRCIDEGVNIFEHVKEVSDDVVNHAIKHGKAMWIDLTNIGISNPTRQKAPSKLQALTELVAHVLGTETDNINIKRKH